MLCYVMRVDRVWSFQFIPYHQKVFCAFQNGSKTMPSTYTATPEIWFRLRMTLMRISTFIITKPFRTQNLKFVKHSWWIIYVGLCIWRSPSVKLWPYLRFQMGFRCSCLRYINLEVINYSQFKCIANGFLCLCDVPNWNFKHAWYNPSVK